MKVRVRFGLKLVWPIRNAAVFVFYTTEEVFAKIEEYMAMVMLYLPEEIKNRVVCERS